MKKILFPTDFSPIAENAFAYAVSLAIDLGATIDLVHIYTIDYTDGQFYAPSHIREVSYAKENWVLERLQAFSKAAPSNLIGKIFCVQGIFTDREIIDLSYEGLYDLLIMGAKGEGNRIERWMGSTTTRTMVEAACPVLVVPATAQYDTIKHLTYATTFDPTDLPAVEQLLAFASQLDASIQFLHINEKEEIAPTTEFVRMVGIPDKLVVFSDVPGNSVEQGVQAYLAKHPVDILALYIPQRGTWERLFHSSFTKKMVFHTETPLLIFHQ